MDIGHQERQLIADKVALCLLTKTYDELAQLAGNEVRADTFLLQQGIDIRRAPYVSLTVGRSGRLRKKMCVEITVVDEDYRREKPGCVYFHKYTNGMVVAWGLGLA